MSTFRLESSLLPDRAHLVGFWGEEAISECYRFDLLLEIPADAAAELDLDDAIGAHATLYVAHDASSASHEYRGSVVELEIVSVADGTAALRIAFAPRLA